MNKKTTKIISTIIVALIVISMVLSMVIQFVRMCSYSDRALNNMRCIETED